jgi:hypothetical protein
MRIHILLLRQNQAARKMKREFLPDEPSNDATVEVTLDLTPDERAWLDAVCREYGLTREQFFLRLQRAYVIEWTFGPGIGPDRFPPPWP